MVTTSSWLFGSKLLRGLTRLVSCCPLVLILKKFGVELLSFVANLIKRMKGTWEIGPTLPTSDLLTVKDKL